VLNWLLFKSYVIICKCNSFEVWCGGGVLNFLVAEPKPWFSPDREIGVETMASAWRKDNCQTTEKLVIVWKDGGLAAAPIPVIPQIFCSGERMISRKVEDAVHWPLSFYVDAVSGRMLQLWQEIEKKILEN
jgi:hypothetical protein